MRNGWALLAFLSCFALTGETVRRDRMTVYKSGVKRVSKPNKLPPKAASLALVLNRYRRSRSKGVRVERSIVDALQANGIAAVRVPPSGVAGGRFAREAG
jgi:hypothetical protein